jgi:phenylalanyl-tRNA synthetase alpha chain
MHSVITPTQLENALALRDLSDPTQGRHAMQLIAEHITCALQEAWGIPVHTSRAHPVVTITDNYGVLGYAPDAPAREARYTRYVDLWTLLRTHTSAVVPGALREAAAAHPEAHDLAVACPGLVYRRDVVDRLHVGEPHQLDLWRARRGPRLTTADLDGMIAIAVAEVLPGARHRATAAAHPYTTDGLEVEVEVDGRWVELLECGLAGGHVLAAAGLDPHEWSGLAMGMGLDRALMLRKGIADIRLLRSDDPRVAAQLLDLDPYREVSAMPATRRDLSIATAWDRTPEELGDRARRSLSELELAAVEEIAVVSETPAAELPPAACARIGIGPEEKNVLVRLVLRHPTRTLTAEQANAIRDTVYAAIHEGAVHQWAGLG